MKALVDLCEALEQALSEALQQCEIIRQEVYDFTSHVSSWPLVRVTTRLTLAKDQIMLYAASLRVQHEGKGYVFVTVGEATLDVYWVEEEYSAADKEWFKSRGWLIVSPDAVVKTAEHLIEEVESGKLAEAVEWLNRYGDGIISDATKHG